MSGLNGISSIGPEFYGFRGPFFQSLKNLFFANMGAWEKWLYNGGDENGQPFPCLRQLIVWKCPKLTGGCTLSLPSLVKIEIYGCNGGLFTCLASLTSMTKLNIRRIPELVHFEGSLATTWVPLKEMRIVECPQFQSIVGGDGGKQVPPNLKVLEMRLCGELEKFADDLFGLTSLSEMNVIDCKKLCSFPSGGLHSSLRRLELQHCPSLPQSQLISIRILDYLEELTLLKLEGLVSITELVGIGSPLSRSLRKLKIMECKNLTTLTDSLQHLSALTYLDLYDLPSLEIEIFPSFPCNLFCFELRSCPKVKSLPHDMYHLTSLKSLSIKDCQGITSLSSRGGLPLNLDSLSIDSCGNLNQRIEEWGLRGLTTFRALTILGEMECVDEMECFPPTTVGGDWSRLVRVGGGLRHHLTSLQSLYIINCERLRCLPQNGLPDSVECLFICGCMEELREKCWKGKGERGILAFPPPTHPIRSY